MFVPMGGQGWAAHNAAMRLIHQPPRHRSDRVPVTAAAHKALEAELERLKLETEREMTERLRNANQYGDGSNNDDYLAILEDKAIVDARIARLEETIARAEVVDHAASDDTVAIGATVTVRDTASTSPVDYVIASAHADTQPGHVSAASPVGEALLGRRRGDRVTVTLPRGRMRRLEVVAIAQPEQ
jgi:transcription elongation factor GreA